MLSYLQAKYDAMMEFHHIHYEATLGLQATLRNDVLFELAEEHHLDDLCVSRAREWIDDYGSIFRMYKKHHFNPAETNDALERTLRWRILELIPILSAEVDEYLSSYEYEQPPFIQCLPTAICDVFGRPVLLVRLGRLFDASVATKQMIVRVHEEMRKRLRTDGHCEEPTLQCVVMIDLKDVAMRSMAVELIPWFAREVAPWFPGMCAAIFVVNRSWAYGMYNVVKRLLPANVLSRVYFPSQSELLSYFESSRLPQDYGGDWDMTPTTLTTTSDFLEGSSTTPLQVKGPREPPHPDTRLSRFLPSMSTLNPYYGYPVLSQPGSSVPYLKNGRRRKRDLIRTLTLLWIAKLKRIADKTWIWIILTLILWALGLKTTDL